jgi:aspartate/methionine/tyrosine aminotransferase
MTDNREIITGSLISYFSNKVKTYGGINLAQGIPGFDPPKELIEILSSEINSKCHQYAPGPGNLQLREEILKMYPKKSNDTSLFITNGATEAISLVYTYLNRIINNKLNALAFSPAYESYIHLPKIFNNNLITIPTEKDSYLDEVNFDKTVQENNINLIFLASPGNPYGRIIPEKEFRFLCEYCNNNKVYLIIDAVYKDLYINEKPYYPIENISEYIFYINSFSKKFSITGWRIGYFFCNQKHHDEISYIHDYIGLSSPAPLQQALAKYLNTCNYTDYVNKIKKIIIENMTICTNELNENGFTCNNVDGGYFVWAKLPDKYSNGLDFGLNLYNEYKTAIIPGQHFGEEWKDYIRINVAREKSELEQGIKNIINFVTQ